MWPKMGQSWPLNSRAEKLSHPTPGVNCHLSAESSCNNQTDDDVLDEKISFNILPDLSAMAAWHNEATKLCSKKNLFVAAKFISESHRSKEIPYPMILTLLQEN